MRWEDYSFCNTDGNFLQKNFQQFSNVFKTSFHDEIGMYMIKQLQRKIVFKSTFKGEIQSQQEKLKFPKPNNLKNILNYYKAPKNFDSKDDREKRSLDSKVPPEQDTCFGEKNEKPTCLANLYDLTIIEHRNENKYSVFNQNQEREQKNREITTEKNYTNIKLLHSQIISKIKKNFINVKQNRNRFTSAIRSLN